MRQNIRPLWYRHIVLLLCWLAYGAIYIGRLNLSIANPIMTEQGVMTVIQVGILGSCFFFSYAFGQVINGILGDRISPRIMITAGLLLAGITNAMICISSVPTALIFVLWTVNGFAQSMLWGPTMRLVSSEYEGEKSGKRAAMVLSTSVGIGSVAAILISTLLADTGYELLFLVPGIILLVLSGILFVFLPTKTAVPVDENPEGKKRNIFKLFTDKRFYKVAFPIFAHGFIKDNLNLWIPTYFMLRFTVSLENVAIYIFMVPLATLFGRLLFPAVYKICRQNEFSAILISFVLIIALLIPLAVMSLKMISATVLICVVSLLISIINAAFLSIYPLRFLEAGNVSSASGSSDFLTYMGAALGSVLIGVFMDTLGHNAVIVSWIVIASLSAVIMLFSINDGLRNRSFV